MADANLIVNTVVTLGVSGTAASIVAAVFSRRKVSAEAEAASASAAQTITATATQLLAPLRAELAELHPQLRGLRTRVVDLESEQEVHRRLLVAHADWDRLAAQRLAEAGILLDQPPPLYPHYPKAVDR